MAVPPVKFPIPNPSPLGSYEIPDGLRQHLQTPDYGADIHSRYRYQAACAALFAIRLLDEKPQHVEVFCECLEDILLKLQDGKYDAIQIKTREKGLDSFRTSDKEILTTIGRFSNYEQDDGTCFRRYMIATNCDFWHAKKAQPWNNF